MNNNLVASLLLSPRMRAFRHLVLFLMNLSIAMGFVWFMEEKGLISSAFQQGLITFFFTIFFWAGCYFTIYILTPGLLLRNRWWWYFFALVGLGLCSMLFIGFIQNAVAGKQTIDCMETPMMPIVNMVSSCSSIILLFAGTSTLVLFKRWISDVQQAEALESATLKMELDLLANQINPHFLFNMLNNAVIMIRRDPDVAEHIIAKLEDMLRYQMNDKQRETVLLDEEIAFLKDFLDLEKTRRDDFTYTIITEGEIKNREIPPLLFISFVENAVKHNIDSQAASYVQLSFYIKGNKLLFICENSIPKVPRTQVGGIGLTNITRRLDLLYQERYSLEQIKTQTHYTVQLTLPL